MPVITSRLLNEIRTYYRLNWNGTHGVIHWNRVYENGMKLAVQEGVNERVVQLFSVFHDSQRRNEILDPGHGSRGAKLALRLRDFFIVTDEELSLLTTACKLHTKARTHENITIQACFDADRLDLGRVGVRPKAKYLCTALAKEEATISWGYKRSLLRDLPEQPFGLLPEQT